MRSHSGNDIFNTLFHLCHALSWKLFTVLCTKGEAHTGLKQEGKDHGATLDTVHQLSDAPAFSSLFLAT